MPDNETNEDANNKRPKRRAAQRTYVSYENTSVWSEDKDLKRALLASLQDAKRSASNSKSSSGFPQKSKKALTLEKINRSDVFSKLKTQSQLVSKACQPLAADNNCSLLSLAAHRRARVSAQRKFAQSSGFSSNSPVSTPIKTGFVSSSNVVDLFPTQRPNTEDFLTFLCLRRSPILPPNLDFIRLNAIEEKKRETDSENISTDELDQNNDKYTSCRINAGVDRRGSASSAVSKATSLSSRASLQISNRKKSEIQRNDNKSQNSVKSKRTQSLNSESGLKNVGSDPNQNLKQSQMKKNLIKSNESENKTFDSLKQKYKQQRIDRKGLISLIPSKSVNSKAIKENETKDKKSSKPEGIQTRQQLRIHSYNQREDKTEPKIKSKNSKSKASERVLRSHHSDSVFTQCLPKVEKISNILIRNTNAKSSKNSLISSQIGIRPKTRKAKPVVPLIDYYFDSEFESESEKKDNKSERKKLINSNEVKSKNLKNNFKDNKNKKIWKSMSEEKEIRSPGRPKGSTKLANKCKTGLSSDSRRIQTRSSRPLSPPKDNKDLERERLIKQQIIAIERKHKRLRRCPSDQSLHSSSSSSSSSSSESLPNSLSSSSSINNTRLTRSLEHLKKIRDIAAKLKKEQNKKADKDKRNDVLRNSSNKKKSIDNKHNLSKSQNILKTKKSVNCIKELKVNNKMKKAIHKNVKERTVTRRIAESVVSATSDTDCDTEAPEPEDVMTEMNGTEEDSMASILGDDMDRASIEMQDMAEDINSLLVNTSNNDLQYGSTEHIEGLMTSGFSAFTDETVSTAFRLQSDSHSEYSYVPQTDDMTTQTRSTVDASTNTTEDDIMACLSSDDTQTQTFDYSSKTTDSSVQTDGPID